MKASRRVIGALFCLSSVPFLPVVSSAAQTIQIQVSSFRPQQGQVVNLSFDLPSAAEEARGSFKAEILVPSVGVKPLAVGALASGKYSASFTVAEDAPQGLYSVHAWTEKNSAPFEVGNSTFLVGKIIADFFEPAVLNQSNSAMDIEGYLRDFGGVGGNLIIAHSIITPDRAYFPCSICKNSAAPGSPDDRIEMLLEGADSRGIGVLMSVSWDMTHPAPYTERWAQTQSIMKDLYRLYRNHPSLVGFYSFQEGSGTYYEPYIRDFAGFAKRLNPGFLTACAPYVDDPLLAGYLGDLPDLDIIMFQGMVMGSYRPDNRKVYPLRRVHDFASLGAGAKKLQNKIAITHVELFGYLESDLGHGFASYQNQYGQFLSAGTVADNDGIAMFAYHANPDVLARLIREKTVLVLPNVSGFQQTDSDLIEAFVRQGGVVIAFGPQIPMGVSYQRSKILGVEELSPAWHKVLIAQVVLGKRVPVGTRSEFPSRQLPSWKSTGARVVATYEDGTPAVAVNHYGKGTAVTISTDAMSAARYFPQLLRDVIDTVMNSDGEQRPVDILGSDDNTDVALSTTIDRFKVAVVNHDQTPLNVTLQPLNAFSGRPADWFDLEKNEKEPIYSGDNSLQLSIPADSFRIIEWRAGAHSSTGVRSNPSRQTQNGVIP